MSLSLRTRAYTRAGNIFYRDNSYSPARGSLWEMAPMLAALSDPGAYHHVFDDFDALHLAATVGGYTAIKDGAVVPGVVDRAGGWIGIPTDVANNNEHYLSSIGQGWLFAADKPLWFEARVALTEANVDDANLIVGLCDTVGADTLLDNGAGPAASYGGAVWFKVDGGTVWQFETSHTTTQVTNANVGAFVSATAYRVGFIFDPADGVTGQLTPYLNGIAGTPHALVLAGMAEMNVLFGCKAGGGAAETLQADYVRVLQVR